MLRTGTLLAATAALLIGPQLLEAQTEQSRWGDEKKSFNLVLTRRANNNAYGTSAFSFRLVSQKLEEHGNYVDLVYNGCGLLHFNPVGGMSSRVADLGEQEDLAVELDPKEKRVWARQAYLPEEGHVYWQEVKCGGQTMTVKYRIQDIERDEIKIQWAVVNELAGPVPSRGMAGTMGQCGGQHRSQ
ncbi:MAG: hypothetical protein P8I27_15135 [Pirellulaceae bacterium]|nr:hypothetical protein [Pirellulaceae bacterium]